MYHHTQYNLTKLDNKTPQYYNTIEVIGDSILNNNPYYIDLINRRQVYWIIDKIQQKKYGPFDFNTIEHEKEKRGILKMLLEHY
ncbi:hypothetical protein [Rhizosphaericola mali]|uniref:Uncharacterized protein n=1 Tax=Rhizosphaericola mali TaxID=2545455 RepID=A0A5P2GCE8_9BACT|nr:hypothetical protein [Rhizosphaericola mali]QES89251.1 hypothetical protein E0W69_011455 [Rhizosphaericola mali]